MLRIEFKSRGAAAGFRIVREGRGEGIGPVGDLMVSNEIYALVAGGKSGHTVVVRWR